MESKRSESYPPPNVFLFAITAKKGKGKRKHQKAILEQNNEPAPSAFNISLISLQK